MDSSKKEAPVHAIEPKNELEKQIITFSDAVEKALGCISITQPIQQKLENSIGYVLARDILAQVDCPSAPSSLRDGYAVKVSDTMHGTNKRPVCLKIKGIVGAGAQHPVKIDQGQTVSITTGAPVPDDAEAVIPYENVNLQDNTISIANSVAAGSYVLPQASEIKKGETIARKGREVTPAVAGLLAASGIHIVHVYSYPKITVISTGSEIRQPGEILKRGELYASNLLTITGWLRKFGFPYRSLIAPDSFSAIKESLETALDGSQAVITIGGTGKSGRDYINAVLEEQGWSLVFHGIRMLPGKNTVFGLFRNIPIMCLPGGPTAAQTAFFKIALPCLLAMTGHKPDPFFRVNARLKKNMKCDTTWTRFHQTRFLSNEEGLWVIPLESTSRLKAMADCQAIVTLPPGGGMIKTGSTIPVEILSNLPTG